MESLQVLACPACQSPHLDFSGLELTETNLPAKGSISCKDCSGTMTVQQGVIVVGEGVAAPMTQLERRNDNAYSDFWQRTHEEFKKERYSSEDELLKVWEETMSQKTILDAGCGSGRHLRNWMALKGKLVVCVDISDAIFQAQKDYEDSGSATPVLFIKSSINHMPLKDQGIELTWSSGTLGLIEDQKAALKEMLRVSGKNVILGVLTEKNLAGKMYIWANFFKPIVNRIGNFRLLFAFAGLMARILKVWIYILYKLGFSTQTLSRDVLRKIVEDPSSTKRLQFSIYDPLIIPKVIKHPDQFYFDVAVASGFELLSQRTEVICDYYEFQRQ